MLGAAGQLLPVDIENEARLPTRVPGSVSDGKRSRGRVVRAEHGNGYPSRAGARGSGLGRILGSTARGRPKGDD